MYPGAAYLLREVPQVCTTASEQQVSCIYGHQYGRLGPRLRKKFQLKPSQCFFVYVNGSDIVTGDTLLSELYERKCNEDGFLYLVYTEQVTFASLILLRSI